MENSYICGLIKNRTYMINEIIKKNGITFGVINGIVSCMIISIIYAIDLNLFLKWWITLVIISISLTLSIILLSKTKKEIQSDFSFKDAFTTYFIYAAIGLLISTLFNIVLWNFIDPSAKETLNELTIKYTVSMMQKFNTPASAINETIKGMKENSQFDIDSQLKGYFFNLLISCIFGLIMAAFFKTRRSSQE
ncbi:DUF4199 domain-containing protein [Flavobacterium sp. 9R]|uniref:DUF4199 domain-containing protein n=1 Tax=Flavobacterium sp. 9R TaxID=2653143 RepID=UPI001F212723|nr:DUF4199 domain-containing protein [Flavobacterium sp. 9R]